MERLKEVVPHTFAIIVERKKTLRINIFFLRLLFLGPEGGRGSLRWHLMWEGVRGES